MVISPINQSELATRVRSHRYALRPIPIIRLNGLPEPAVGRLTIPVNPQDPRNAETLFNIKDLGVCGQNYYARADGLNPPYFKRLDGSITELLLREDAAKRLAAADAQLRSTGLRLFVLDGYRTISTQQSLWKFYFDRFRRLHPRSAFEDIEAETRKFVSDPRRFHINDASSWPLHSTGGAVDLCIVSDDEQVLDFGTAFDETTDRSRTSYFEEALLSREVKPDDIRLLSRRILFWSMWSEGFTNYMDEWWHFDIGNQMHVYMLRLQSKPLGSLEAWYGYIDLPRHTVETEI